MARLLYIETATKVCSVAISDGDRLVGIRENTVAYSHAEMLSPYIEELIKEHQWEYKDLDAIVVSKGPGSYTGLRIGVSSAKGLCYSLEIPLISLGTLQSMANGMRSMIKEDGTAIICPMIDARRMEVYSALYDLNNKEIRGTEAQIIDEDSFSGLFKKHTIYFAGDGADKCKEIFTNQPHAKFLDDFQISSKYMVEIANKKFENKEFEDVAYFEPYYLKDFIAGKPKVKGLE